MILILDRDLEVLGALNNKSPRACPYFDDEHLEQLEDGVSTYSFSAPADHEASAYLIAENYVIVKNLDNKLELFKIKEVHAGRQNGIETKQILSENVAVGDLIGEIVRPQSLVGVSGEDAVKTLLGASEWQVGTVEWLGTQDLDFNDYPTVLKAIRNVADAFGGEIRFRVEMSGAKVTGKFVDLLVQRGEENGVRFEYAHDLDGLTRIEDSTEVVTAIIGLGKSASDGTRLTMTDATWSVASGDPIDKPSGQDWVGDPDALQRWGRNNKHIFGVYDNGDLTSAEAVLQRSWDYLQENNKPKLTYETSLVLLGRLAGYEHKKIRLGDTVYVIDKTFTPDLILEARVIEIRRSYTDETRDSATIGDYRPITINDDATVQWLQNNFNASAGIWDSKETPEGAALKASAAQSAAESYTVDYAEKKVVKSATAPTDTTVLWIDTKTVPNVLKHYVGSAWVKATPTEADEINETTGRKWAAESGADKTSNNTAANTAKVGGTDAATVETNASNGATAHTKITNEVGTGTIETTSGASNKASTAESNANGYTENYAEKKVVKQGTAPTDTTVLWIDTTVVPNILKHYDATTSAWVKVTPTTADEIDESTGRKWAGESGADITGNNTAANTSMVGGTAASTVEQNAANGNTAHGKITNEVGTGTIETTSGAQAKANAAEGNAKSYTDSNAEKKVWRSTTAPTDTSLLWIDTSVVPNIFKHYDSTSATWIRATPINAADVGAETPSGAQAKATAAETNAKTYTEGWSEQGADVTANNTAANTAKVGGTSAATVEANAANGNTAHAKITAEVGTGTLETTSGAQAKATDAETNAKTYASDAGNVKYSDGTAVDALKPAAAGADKTSDNTAANTAKVGNTLASTVETNAANGASAHTKITSEVGSGTIETTTGAASKATAAETNAKTFAGDANNVKYSDGTAVNALKPAAAGADVTANNAAKAVNTPDTRNNNELPSWYRTNYDKQVVSEFKSRSVIGAPGSTLYGTLTTKVSWSDPSGGPIIQIYRSADGTFIRQSNGDDTAWLAWHKSYDELNKPDLGNGDILNPKAEHLTYTDGSTVEALKPAQAGADKTSANTAADTSKVGGTAAATVRDNASNGNTAHTKITNEVGTGTIETTSGSQAKATGAETNAKNAVANGQVNLPSSKLVGDLTITASRKIMTDSNFYWDTVGLIGINPADTTKQVRLSSGGLAISKDGGATFSTAITGDGILAEAITAGTISGVTISGSTFHSEGVNGHNYVNISGSTIHAEGRWYEDADTSFHYGVFDFDGGTITNETGTVDNTTDVKSPQTITTINKYGYQVNNDGSMGVYISNGEGVTFGDWFDGYNAHGGLYTDSGNLGDPSVPTADQGEGLTIFGKGGIHAISPLQVNGELTLQDRFTSNNNSQGSMGISSGALPTLATYNWTQVPFNSASVDNWGEWDYTNHRFVTKKGGIYFVAASVSVNDMPANSAFALSIHKSGGEYARVYQDIMAYSGKQVANGSAFVFTSDNSYIELFVYVGGGTMNATTTETWMKIIRIG